MKSGQSVNICTKIKQMLLPQRCLLCGATQDNACGICHDCLGDLPWRPASCCPCCSLPTLDRQLCGHCLHSPPAFDLTQALFGYQYPLHALLQRYKYDHQLTLATCFALLLAEKLPLARPPDLLIPMPLHPQRLKQRGFNQAVEIARIVADRLKIPLDTQSCSRIKLTPPQVSLPLKARVKNMRGVFSCHRRLDGMHVALLDDVMTTGASLDSLAKTVKAAGAAHVECWVLARTLPK